MTFLSQLGCQDDDTNTVVVDAIAADGALNGGENTDAKSVGTGPGGLFPKALDLNGTDDYISSATLDTSGVLTVCAWVDVDTLSNFRGIWSSRDLPANGNSQFYITGDLLRFRQAGNGTDTTATTALTSGWHHVAAVRTGTTDNWTVTLYIDAVEVGSAAITANPPSGALATCWGRSAFASNYWDGRMADLRIYNDAKDEAGLATIMEDATGGGGPNVPGLSLNARRRRVA